MLDVAISPSGQRVAIIKANGPDQSMLATGPFENGHLGDLHGIDLGQFKAVDIQFKGEDQLVVVMIQRGVQIRNARGIDGERYTFDRAIVVGMGLDGSNVRLLSGQAAFGAEIQSTLPNDPAHILLAVVDPARYATDLVRVDVTTGEGEVVERGRFVEKNEMGTRLGPQSLRTRDWRVDINGVPFIRIDQDRAHKETIVYARPIGGSQWTKFTSFPDIEGRPPIDFAGLASPNSVYVYDRAGGDKRAIWEYDLSSGRPIRQVMADPAGEAVGIQAHAYKGDLAGAVFYRDGQLKPVYAAKGLAAAQGALDSSFPNFALNRIIGYARDMGTIAVRSEGPDTPPVTMLLDVRRMEVVTLDNGFVPSRELGRTQTIHYASADGRTITAFLTLPPGGSTKLPLVVMPHGGPAVADELDYDGWRAFLASRGYAVLQPQFRGSSGFGKAFERAGDGAWGTAVQDDVRAGLAYVTGKGIADPSRVCIFGWSYGGYMAMAGAALSPDLYKCAIAGAGVSDFSTMMQFEIETYGGRSPPAVYWNGLMGAEPGRSQASPARYAANVKAPMLLIHGERDDVVPIKQSEIMEAALKKAGKEVTFVRLPGEGHSPSFPAEAKVLRQIEAFLAQNIGR